MKGVAGADIISTNLSSREGALAEVFNPTVPGKSVYALFAFAAINGFDHALKCLGGDVMILIKAWDDHPRGHKARNQGWHSNSRINSKFKLSLA